MTWRQCRCSVKSHSTYSIYLSETFWDCLVLMVRIYICRAARRSAVSYFSSDPNRSNTTSLQLCRNPIGREVDSEQEEVTLQSICSSQQQHTHTQNCVRWHGERKFLPPPTAVRYIMLFQWSAWAALANTDLNIQVLKRYCVPSQ